MPRMKWYGWAWGVVELFVFAWLVTLDPHARGWFGMTNRIWLVLVAIGLLTFLVSVLFAAADFRVGTPLRSPPAVR